ncbi:two-component sensor histidine kinase [Haloferula helveola]|uniref:histidine kinase n=1 Tax=Haloferula helveola TaxID=490095 RepID=A0ABN6H7W3_9BACT|nr:two-component sensor histidine kinase [Haloferula helveola]
MRLTRITLLIIALIIGSGFYLLVRRQLDEVEPQTFQATEESMVDTAHLLASFVEADLDGGEFDPERFAKAFDISESREFRARIYSHLKTTVGVGAYVTDRQGIVLFDSKYPERVGQDFSAMRDVHLTLQGHYGARSSRSEEGDPASSVLHIAAPVGDPENPWGVLTVYKPQSDVLPIVRRRRSEIWWGTGLIGGGILFLVGAVFIWQYRPISRLTDYARAIEQGKRPPSPPLGAGREVNTLARALESMREALEGRKYAERYVQTLTHEMKSPLAAIRGAAELLDENMPAADRSRFLNNIRAESARADRLLNRLLELSALEGRSQLDSTDTVDFSDVVRRAIDQGRPLAELAGVTLSIDLPEEPVEVLGDAFILRAAVTNLLENAIDFSPSGETVSIRLSGSDETVLTIEDHGPGIPDYAREKIFERFFSLRHLKAGRKGTGLGLTLVKEAAELHGGRIALDPVDPNGTRAVLTLPSAGKP